jgi:DNA-binding IclR family transcriptional regulator
MGSSEAKIIKSIVKAAAVVDLLAVSDSPLALSVIAKKLNMAKSTLHGILATLITVGYISQDGESGHYSLGLKLFEVGNTVSRKWNERRLAYPYMQDLVEKTGETVHLAILDDGEVLYINKLESSGSIRIVTESGIKLPAHCTGVGKALLSGLKPYELNEFAAKRGLDRYTDTTITDLETLKAELELIRSRGYATDDQEYIEGLRCVSVPIFNHKGRVTCALSVAGPVARMRDEAFEEVKRHLLTAAREVSRQMDYQGGFAGE